MNKIKEMLSIITITVIGTASISLTAFAMPTEEFDNNIQYAIDAYNAGEYQKAQAEFQNFCDENWDDLNEGQQKYIQDYLDGIEKQKYKRSPLTTEEFDEGMAKGIDYFNRGLYHEAYDEFKWFRDAQYENMNPEQQKYIDEYLYGAKVKREETEPYWYNKKYDTMGWVYSCYRNSGAYRFQGKKYTYDYTIPKFNSNSESVQNLNERLYDNIYKSINSSLKALNSSGCVSINYTKYWEAKYLNYVSIIIESQSTDDDNIYYSTGTINIAENKEVNNEELVAKTGYSKEQFLDILENFVTNKCYEINKSFINRGWGNFDKLKTLISSTQYLTINLPMSVSDNGHLIVYAKIPTLVASGNIRCIIDTGLMVY